MADLLRLLQNGGRQLLLRVLREEVDGPAVGLGHAGHVVSGLGPALQLQAGDPRLHHGGDVLDHPHVVGVEDVRPPLLLEDLKLPLGPLLLHQGVLPAAGLGALPPVGVPPGEVVGEQAPPGKGHAHRAVGEGLQLQPGVHLLPDLPDLRQGHLPGQHHPAGPQFEAGLGGGVVHHAELGGDVPLHLGGVLLGQGHHPQVRQDEPVHPRLLAELEEGYHLRQLLVPGQGVAGDVHLHPPPVAQGHPFLQLLAGEVGRCGAHPEVLAPQVHRVRAVVHRGPQPLHVSRRGQQLRFSPLHQSRPASCRLYRWSYSLLA